MSFALQRDELVLVEFAGDNLQSFIRELFLELFNQREQYARVLIGAKDSVGLSWVGNTVAEDEPAFAAIFEEIDQGGADVIRKAILADGLVKDAIKGVGFGGGFVRVIDSDLVEGFVDVDEWALLLWEEGFESAGDCDVVGGVDWRVLRGGKAGVDGWFRWGLLHMKWNIYLSSKLKFENKPTLLVNWLLISQDL